VSRAAAAVVVAGLMVAGGCSFRNLDRLLADAPDAASLPVEAGRDANVPSTELSKLVSSLQPGSWAKLDTVGLTSNFLAAEDGNTILAYADSAVWDSASQQLVFLGGNLSHKHIVFSATTNAWRVEARQSWFCSGDCTAQAHDQHTLDSARGVMFYRAFNSSAVRRYDVANAAWDTVADLPGSEGVCCGGLAYFPEANGLVFAFGGSVRRWDEPSNTWTEVTEQLAMGAYNNVAEYDPVHKVVYFGGGRDSRAFYKIDPSMKITKLADAPISNWIASANTVVDPVSGHCLVIVNTPASAFHEYDPDADAWRTLPTPPFPNPAYTPTGVAAALPEHGVILALRGDPAQLWVYRHR
jgi:hypothetical protein